MYAIIGIPGSTHHRFRHYPRSQSDQAWAWLNETRQAILRRNPAISDLPIRLIADNKAAKIRWQSGGRVYNADEPWTEDWA